MRAMRNIRSLWPIGCAILAAAVFGGCSTGTTTSGLNLVDAQGNHPANFLSTHPRFAVADVEQCKDCHGNDLAGGIANTSCFTAACHHGTETGWVVFPSGPPQGHGISAKEAPGSSGFASCQICHASDFSGGGAKKSCFLCHTPPHPNSWRSFNVYKHTTTDLANASVCARCHLNGNNSPLPPPSPPAPAGTPPGCFNSTLCHSVLAAPHALGSAWTAPNPAFHGLTAKQDLSFCQTCHGTPGTIQFNGGVASTSCAGCHPQARAHAIRWNEAPQTGFPPYTPSHRNSGNRTVACAICHKVDGAGTGPDPGAPSCFSASFNGATCHSGGPGAANHAVPNLEPTHIQATQTDFGSNCSNCHSLSGTSPVSSAPLCTTCHTNLSASNPLTTKDCTSCHAEPPAGTAYPNIAGAHAVHLGLDNALTPVSCDTCHTGLGSGTQAHYDRANARPGKDAFRVPPGDAAFGVTYNAKSGAPSFDNTALTCANVSCHGATTTPNWRTGTIDVNANAGCRQCHSLGSGPGVPQYNAYWSGEHDRHAETDRENLACTVCHDPAKLADPAVGKHFLNLSTTALDTRASVTIGGGTTQVQTYSPGGTVGTGSCTPTSQSACHNTRSW